MSQKYQDFMSFVNHATYMAISSIIFFVFKCIKEFNETQSFENFLTYFCIRNKNSELNKALLSVKFPFF